MPDILVNIQGGGRSVIECPGSNNATRVYVRSRPVQPGGERFTFWAGLVHGPQGDTALTRCVGGEKVKGSHPGIVLEYNNYPYWVQQGYPLATPGRRNFLVLDYEPNRVIAFAVWFAVGGALSAAQADIATWQ